MTQEIIALAREAGWTGIYREWSSPINCTSLTIPVTMEQIKAFHNLAIAKEREACARVCETLWNTKDNGMATEEEAYGENCAAAIRARKETA